MVVFGENKKYQNKNNDIKERPTVVNFFCFEIYICYHYKFK